MGHSSPLTRLRRSIAKKINRFYLKRFSLQEHPVDYYVSLLERNKPFTFVRYGDGEWAAMLGYPGGNCDGHEYFPELGEKLRNAVCRPFGYFYGIQKSAMVNDARGMLEFIRKNGVSIEWHNANVFHYANRDGNLNSFVKQLRSKPTVIISSPPLRNLKPDILNYAHFIEIPPKNCFLDVDRVIDEVKAYHQEVPSGVIYAFSASMMANVAIHELYPLLGGKNWLLDLGSLWDMYLGINSRSGYGNKKWENLRLVNLAR